MPRHAVALVALSLAITVLANSPLTAGETSGLPPYTWSISNSSTDPTVNTGPPSFGVRMLFLWATPNTAFGWDQACFDLVATGMTILTVNPGMGIQMVDDCYYAPCLTGSMIVATVTVLDQPGEICFGPSITTGENCTRDCNLIPARWENSWTGYTNVGSSPCSYLTWLPCEAVGAEPEVEPGTWGRIKTQYR